MQVRGITYRHSAYCPQALVGRVVATYIQDSLLHDEFYADDSLKRFSDAETVEHVRIAKPAQADWGERIFFFDFDKLVLPTKAWGSIPPIQVHVFRTVMNQTVASGRVLVAFQADYADLHQRLIIPLLGRACREDKDLEIAQEMAITREPFNPPLSGRSPQILSCVGVRKKMILNFGLAKVGADSMLTSIEVFEEAM